ncbi:hypothetical protein DPMN_026894 [Dreissena polymorpha]|uniref:Uncharacterized protein n=1 Tax=Dreissena polymorpha TaxID=45954 RepID=A0A9D4LSH7_DREPO|nr:hypothetical protein DPMN_026894 [Dreissena polymorpha]
MESDGKLVPILHGIPSNDFHRIPYDSTADLQTGNLASRVLTRFYYSHIRKNAPPPWKPFFQAKLPLKKHCQANIIIFELIQDFIETNLLTKCHEDWTINVASREKYPAPGGHVFKATKTIFELIQDIIRKNLLTKFHDDREINVTSTVLTRKIAPPPWWPYITGMNILTEYHEDQTINVASRVKNAPPLGDHVFQANVTILELIQDIIKANHLTIFNQDWTINVASRVKNAPPPGGHVFQPTGIIFELIQDIIWMNLPTKFHEDWTITVASRVKNTPPLGSHVFQAKFHEDRKINSYIKICPVPWRPYIIGINLLTKFYEDHTITVASRVKNAPPLGSHVFQANITIF